MWLYRANRQLPRVLPFSWLWGLELRGCVSTFPRRGPVLLAINHASFLDPWFLGFVLERPVGYLINQRWYHRSRLWRALFAAWGTIPIRSGDPAATVDDVCAALARGLQVGVFPEGGISRDGRMARLRNGIGYMAAQSGAPVVPVGLRGSDEILPPGRLVPRGGRLSVHLGEPRRFPGAPTRHPSREDVLHFVHALERDLRRFAGKTEGRTSLPRWSAAHARRRGGGFPTIHAREAS